jgi:uroporphyrin-III C-methyltransferase/precorrin-2 dehydrogenase/sirohydrochlorin ferrochelatase
VDYFPIFTKLENKPILIIGGGDVALRKCQAMLNANAQVTLVSPRFCQQLDKLEESKQVTLIRDYFCASHITNPSLVIAATDSDTVNKAVFEAANNKNIFVNVVDDQPKCSFIFPSIVDRNPLTIAISSAGKAPVLARRLREKLEIVIPQHIGPLAELAGRFRNKVKNKLDSFSQRRMFWEKAFTSKAVSHVAKGNLAAAEHVFESILSGNHSLSGEVMIVGAGPGDPELLTIKALQAMQTADVIVYDYLVSEEVMKLVRKDADLICVGKRCGNHSVPQSTTNQLLVSLAEKGKKVCRLKGGDPFIYGRGGEEAQALAKHNIAFQIVPGITAAAGCSAYAGIPLTHRDYAQSIHFITGHCKTDADTLDWQSLAKTNQTLAVYMGVIKSHHIQNKLIEHGRATNTPVAIIENGTRKEQRVVIGTLDDLAQLVEREQIKSPALLIIGEVAGLSTQLSWFSESNKQEKSYFTLPLTNAA